MVFCSSCGNEESSEKSFCSKCGSNLSSPSREQSSGLKRRSSWWYVLSIFISPIGGIISYFVIRHDDPEKARNCLIIGFIVFAIGFVMGISLS